MSDEIIAATETRNGATIPPAEPTPEERFLAHVHDRLMMAHGLVTFRVRQVNADGSATLALVDKDLAFARYAAGVLIYADRARTWTYAGDGMDGVASDAPACVLVRVTPYP